MMRVKYENSQGTELNLNDGNYFVNENDLKSFVWDYEITGRTSGLGGKVKRFSRQAAEKSLKIAVRGTQEQFAARMNALHALTEPDILSCTPGKLWLNGQYIICYLGVSSGITGESRRGLYAEKEMTVVAVEPFWHTEETHHFRPTTGSVTGGKKYNLRYPYRFGTGYSNSTLYNNHYASTPMILTIYGPVTNPEVTIAGQLYAVTAVILASERLVVDQIARTITKIDASGGKYNMFDARNKENDIFLHAPSGNSSVQFSNLTFDVTLIQRRSEPKWT